MRHERAAAAGRRFGGALLPRAGAWMDGVKQFFGVMLLGVAIWMVQPVLPAELVLALWGALLLARRALLVEFRRAGAPARCGDWRVAAVRAA